MLKLLLRLLLLLRLRLNKYIEQQRCCRIAPLVAAGIMSAVASLAGTAANRKNTSDALSAQRGEQSRQRQYELELAGKQNEWNIQQWRRENDYNSPAAQMSRLKAAGLNPDMVYGEGGATMPSAASPQMTAGRSAPPVDYSAVAGQKTIGGALAEANLQNIIANSKKTEAETNAINTATKGQESSNKILESDAAFRDALNQGNLDMQSVNIELGWTRVDLGNTDIAKARQEMTKMEHECNILIAERDVVLQKFKLMEVQTAIAEIEKNLAAPMGRAQIRALSESANVSHATARQIIKESTLSYLNLKQEYHNKVAAGQLYPLMELKYDAETGKMVYETERDKRWETWDKLVTPATEVAKGVAVGVGVAKSKGKSPTRVSTAERYDGKGVYKGEVVTRHNW